MLSRKFITLISEHTSKLGEEWAKQVKKTSHMKAHQRLSESELQMRNQRFFENLAKWFEEGASHDKIKNYFASISRERYHEGIPLDEINFGIIIGKRILWNLILSEGFFPNAVAIYQALEMITMIYNFFDLGYFYIGKEYMEEMYEMIHRSNKLTEKELRNYLFPGGSIPDKELEEMLRKPLTLENKQS